MSIILYFFLPVFSLANTSTPHSAMYQCYAAIYKMQYAVYSYSDGPIQKEAPSAFSRELEVPVSLNNKTSPLGLLFYGHNESQHGYFVATPYTLSFFEKSKTEKSCLAKNQMVQMAVLDSRQKESFYFGFSPPTAPAENAPINLVAEHIPNIQQWLDRRDQTQKDFCNLKATPTPSPSAQKAWALVLAEKIKTSVAKDMEDTRNAARREAEEMNPPPQVHTIADSDNPQLSFLKDVAATILACRQPKEHQSLQRAVDLLEAYHATKNKELLERKRREKAKELSL